MELVYLWVEEYKNIENQGFNFSPKFEFHYDKDSKKLTKIRDESTTYKSIFPNNINITAIVGENGSGKTSLIHQLLEKDNFSCSSLEDDSFFNKKRLWIYTNNHIQEINFDDLSSFNDILLISEDLESNICDNKYNINTYLKNNLHLADSYIINNLTISFLFNSNKYEHLNDFNFVPTNINLKFLNSFNINKLNNLIGHRFESINDWHDTKEHNIIYEEDIKKFIDYLNKELIKSLDTFNTNNTIKSYLYLREFFYKLTQNHRKSLKLFEELYLKNFEEENLINELNERLFSTNDEDIFKTIINEITNIEKVVYHNTIQIDISNPKLEKLLSNIHRGFFDIEFLKKHNNDEIYFSDLSSGEQKLVLIFSRIFYLFRKLFTNRENDILLFLDEIEAYLHPKWQKNLLSYILIFIKNTEILKNKKFNIIMTSHSPFILSDIPKENVIFLKNGKQEKPFKENEQTFGANIHTLLSHGFFMEDGLMGELAKSKIEEIKKFYDFIQKFKSKINAKEKIKERVKKYYLNKKEKFNHIQSIIGEPFLKTIIGNYLDEFEQIFDTKSYKSNKKQELLKQFSEKELEEYLESLKNAKA